MNSSNVGFVSFSKKVVILLVVAALFFLVKYSFFTTFRPASNSQEYISQHGVIKGVSTELIVKGALLRVPAGYPVNPYTDVDKKIIKGEADSVEVYIDIIGGEVAPPKYSSGEVQIRIANQGSENDKNLEEYLLHQTKGIGSAVEGLGLYNFLTDGRGGWGNLILEPLDGTKTPKGGRIIFSCNGKGLENPGGCKTSYQHFTGLMVEYFFSGASLSNWKAINSQVVSFVDSIVIPKGV